MLKARVGVFTAVLVLAVLCATPVSADVEKGTGEVGIDVGYTELDNKIGNAGARFSFRGGYHFTDTLQLDSRGETSGITIKLDEDAEAVEVNARIVADRRSNSLVVTATAYVTFVLFW